MNSCTLYVGTEDGLRTVRITDVDTIEHLETGLKGQAVRAIAIHPDDPSIAYVGCGLRGWGLHYTDDSCETFTSIGFEDEWVWDVTFAPDADTIYAGTEPPMVYVSHDGRSFDALSAIEMLESRSPKDCQRRIQLIRCVFIQPTPVYCSMQELARRRTASCS